MGQAMEVFQVDGAFAGDVSEKHPAALDRYDKTPMGQDIDGFADRVAADPELFDQVIFRREFVGGFETSFSDVFLQLFFNGLVFGLRVFHALIIP